MSSEVRITNKCSVKCPKVREKLRAAIAEAPWLADEVFPQRKARIIPEKTRELYDEKVDFVEERELVVEKTKEQDDKEIDFVEERELVVETTTKWDDEEVDFIEKKELLVEKAKEWVDEEADFVEARELVVEQMKEKIDEEADFIEAREPIVEKTKERVDKKADFVETRELVVEKAKEWVDEEADFIEAREPIVEKTKERVDEKADFVEERKLVIERTTEERDDEEVDFIEEKELVVEKAAVEEDRIDEDKIDRTTITSAKFELEAKADAKSQLPRDVPARHMESRREKEEDDDYDEFIDEELQRSLPIATAKQIPEDKEEAKKVDRKKIPDKDVEINHNEHVGPSVPEVSHRVRARDEKDIPVVSTMKPARAFTPKSAAAEEDACDDTCPVIIQQKERIMRKLEERQRIVDHYYLTKGFSYFEDVCTCSLACVLYTLSRDQFVRSIFASLALFAVGLKLCSELDAWEMPSRIS